MTDNMTAEQALAERFDRVSLRMPATHSGKALMTFTEEEIDIIRQALSAPRVPAGWQPIETAPMDGTAVLVMRDIWPGTKSGRAEECNGHNTYVAEWWSEEGHGGKWVCYMNAVLDPVCPIVPTHWMPLPHPPSMLATRRAITLAAAEIGKEMGK